MLSSHIVASLVLAGLSMAHPHQNHPVPARIHATTPEPTEVFPIVPTGTVASFDDQISSTAQLSERQDPSSDDGDWDEVAKGGIGGLVGIAKIIADLIGGGEQETVSHTVTITQEPGKPTPTEDSGKPSAPAKTIITTVTSITAPGKTVTTTVAPTTVAPKPEPTETRKWPIPEVPGCSPGDEDCDEE